MRVTHLMLQDFRNYQEAEVSFQAGPNLVIGRNGQGKTNLVEAIAYFATLGSHRVSGDSALIRAKSDSAVVRMRVAVADRNVLLEAQINRHRANRAQVNRNAVKSRELSRWFSCVVFAPEDLLLVRGEPATRRKFLDEAVVARTPSFAGVLSDYEKVVRQRTALLKGARSKSNDVEVEQALEFWNSQLVELGASIMLARRSLVDALADPIHSSYETIVQNDHEPAIFLDESVLTSRGKNDVSRETSLLLEEGSGARSGVSDVSRETLEASFWEALATVKNRELERGVTLVGPHRDDALFSLNGLPVKGYASHGETWSFTLALRLAVAELLRAESITGDPVIILDDVFAELDSGRRVALMGSVEKYEQVIVTAAVEADVPDGSWSRIYIDSGAVLEDGQSHAEG